MHVLFISSWWPTVVHPTNGNFVEKHARLMGRRHTLTVMAVQDDVSLEAFELKLSIKETESYTQYIMYYGRRSGTFGFLHLLNRMRAYFVCWRKIRFSIPRLPHLIHGHILVDGGIVAAILGRRYNIPVAITEHASIWSDSDSIGQLKHRLAKWACATASIILPVTYQLGRRMQEGHDLRGRYRTISNVVDDQLFTYKEKQNRKREPLRLLHVSNFDPRFKNVAGLLSVFAKLKTQNPDLYHLTLAGDGDRSEVEAWIHHAGLLKSEVCVSGPHTESEVADLMAAADVFVLFSDQENQPVVLLEAQCCGLPCIATRVGGVERIIIEGVTGYLVDPGDEAALEATVKRIHKSFGQFDRQAISDRATALYGNKAVANQMDEVYSQIVDG
ncbi:glycosyltransferase involved in cell wall biosynthesis [Neolewinella xylanilytica]|uniref:Glycosyltransferase involved in cell wall biosynthesis n=1 Tax=Neolewinella xylanilytica TaxID=1514080 RepID=A0A2S6I0J0_9BACT|nr:glycosyltransferase [Neolewinella xylanilytica]PPK84374.1 glycosyltransferase involved in cell wall biosynthesis [Neolewinella xylanilytica]